MAMIDYLERVNLSVLAARPRQQQCHNSSAQGRLQHKKKKVGVAVWFGLEFLFVVRRKRLSVWREAILIRLITSRDLGNVADISHFARRISLDASTTVLHEYLVVEGNVSKKNEDHGVADFGSMTTNH